MTPGAMLAQLEADGNALAEATRNLLRYVEDGFGGPNADEEAAAEALANWDKRLWRATAPAAAAGEPVPYETGEWPE